MWDHIVSQSVQANWMFLLCKWVPHADYCIFFYSIIGSMVINIINDHLPYKLIMVLCTFLMTKSNLYMIWVHRIHKDIVAKGGNKINVICVISKVVTIWSKNSCWFLIVGILLLKLLWTVELTHSLRFLPKCIHL